MTDDENIQVTENAPDFKIEKSRGRLFAEKMDSGEINKYFNTASKAIELARDFFTTIDRIGKLFSGEPVDIRPSPEDSPSYRIVQNNYGGYYRSSQQAQPQPRASELEEYKYITVDSYYNAEEALSRMRAIIERDGQCSLIQLYDILRSMNSNFQYTAPYTCNNWGWDNLYGVRPRPQGSRYSLNLPPIRRI